MTPSYLHFCFCSSINFALTFFKYKPITLNFITLILANFKFAPHCLCFLHSYLLKLYFYIPDSKNPSV